MLTKEKVFVFDITKKLGHVRAEFGFKGLNASQFVKTIDDKIQDYADPQRIDTAVNKLLEEVKNLDHIIELTDGFEGYEYHSNLFYADDNCNYWIRVIPVIHDYNCYISIYKK